jgi:ferredoxin
MKNVTILPGCITCGLCESLAPTVFEVTDIARTRPDAPINACRDAVRKAAAECPVQVIKIENEEL